MSTLAGKSIVVTGSGQGLGRAYALDAARAGASVVVNDVDATATQSVVAEILDNGGSAIAAVGSAADWDGARHLVDTCVTRFGAIDGFVANAAIKHEGLPWDETEAGLRRIVDVNVLGVMFGGTHAMRAMVDSGRGGSVVTVVSGARFGIPGMSAYGATKGAVAGMTLNWAIEGMPHHVRVNAISPLGRTRMSSVDARDDAPQFPDPAAVAPLVTALLSDDTVGTTGRIIRFDGTTLSQYADAALEDGEERASWTVAELAASVRRWR
ncbi:hypothetical protein ASD65_09820 [Microbacterium sp. Root61]|uniref:SDR family NAD(P)-dependent oxidoreductase n=1 Tax=Microbacterium sp. Root61 TaxID=1736570 RepID=UPI0006F7E427|nr:SDR family oxidoreductase [Microbacterium sp. Root61]KRA24677.1 hypothetical protein ASD65_09820 [Microbacterium sp. Root61]